MIARCHLAQAFTKNVKARPELLFCQLKQETVAVIPADLTVAVWHILQQSVKATDGKQRTVSVTDYERNSGHYNAVRPARLER